jgi:hypothetical protein
VAGRLPERTPDVFWVRRSRRPCAAQAKKTVGCVHDASAFDIGTGTGVLAAVLARRGISRVVADCDARALACLDLQARSGLLAAFDAAGVQIAGRSDVRPRHPRAFDETDPLHPARAAEVTSLWRIAVR